MLLPKTGWFRREQIINKLRELGLRYKRRANSDRNDIYKKSGSGITVVLPRKKLIPASTCVMILRSAECGNDEIESFLKEAEGILPN